MSVQGAINNVINTAAGASVINTAIGDEAMEKKRREGRLKKYGDEFDKAAGEVYLEFENKPNKRAQFQKNVGEVSDLRKEYLSNVDTESRILDKLERSAPTKEERARIERYGKDVLAKNRLERVKKQLQEKAIIRRSPRETKQFADISTANAIDEKRISNDSKKNIDLYIGGKRVDFTSENNPKGEIPEFLLKQLKGGVK